MTSDRWAGGAEYECFVGRWSRSIAPEFLTWLAVPPGARWVDVGCGTGAVSAAILDRASPASVLGLDPSPDFIDHVRATLPDARARFEVGSADAIPLDAGSVDAVAAGLVLNFVPDIPTALAEMRRVARPSGRIGAYVWDYARRMEVIRRYWDAAIAIEPAAAEMDEGRRFAIAHPDALASAFRAAGLADVEVRAIEVPADFSGFEDYWTPFLSGIGPAPGYNMSLDETRRAAVRERLRSTLPVETDGSIHLVARAWAARGTV